MGALKHHAARIALRPVHNSCRGVMRGFVTGANVKILREFRSVRPSRESASWGALPGVRSPLPVFNRAISSKMLHQTCRTWVTLLADYKNAVWLYINAVLNLPGLVEDDSRLGREQAEPLSQICRQANKALMDHWREKHRLPNTFLIL